MGKGARDGRGILLAGETTRAQDLAPPPAVVPEGRGGWLLTSSGPFSLARLVGQNFGRWDRGIKTEKAAVIYKTQREPRADSGTCEAS